jgi:hypothetical protein
MLPDNNIAAPPSLQSPYSRSNSGVGNPAGDANPSVIAALHIRFEICTPHGSVSGLLKIDAIFASLFSA